MSELRFKLTGVAPILLHSDRMSDPLDPMAKVFKKVSGKRNKTEEDHAEMARLEWYGSLYVENGRVVIPGENIEAMLVAAAKKNRAGKQAQVGLFCLENPILTYDGPADIDALWGDGRFLFRCGVRIGTSRVQRTRPRFDKWEVDVTVQFDPQEFNREDVIDLMIVAGQKIGLCDWRPKFGRFSVEVL